METFETDGDRLWWKDKRIHFHIQMQNKTKQKNQ